jgi:hypothetical protein
MIGANQQSICFVGLSKVAFTTIAGAEEENNIKTW